MWRWLGGGEVVGLGIIVQENLLMLGFGSNRVFADFAAGWANKASCLRFS